MIIRKSNICFKGIKCILPFSFWVLFLFVMLKGYWFILISPTLPPSTLRSLQREADLKGGGKLTWEEGGNVQTKEWGHQTDPHQTELSHRPKIHVSTGKESSGSDTDSTQGLRTGIDGRGIPRGPRATRMGTGLSWGHQSVSLRSPT